MGLFDKIKKMFQEEQTENEQEELNQSENEQEVSSEDSLADDETVIAEGQEETIVVDGALEESKTPEVTVEKEEVLVAEPEDVVKNAEVVSQFNESTTEKYDKGLEKTRKTFSQRMNELFANFRTVDEEFFEALEETLIGADVGFEMAMEISDALRQEVKLQNVKKSKDIQEVIVEKMVSLYEEQGEGEDLTLHMNPNGTTVILFVGVNGVGKTTSIGKMAHQLKEQGKKVLMAAGDTFRAGAIEQLVEWGRRVDVPVVTGDEGGDPASVVFDAVARAKSENADVLLVDTAGRLQNKVNLMKELEKIKRVIQREMPEAPQEILLVLDATTGQNAMIQAKQFKETTDVTGIVLTKLDGTAKGGIVLAIRNELHMPVKLVGLGEGMNDLQVFAPKEYIYGLFKELLQ